VLTSWWVSRSTSLLLLSSIHVSFLPVYEPPCFPNSKTIPIPKHQSLTPPPTQWGKRLTSLSACPSDPDSILAIFDDGTSYTGTLAVGADGAWSTVRRILTTTSSSPTTTTTTTNPPWQNRRLPCNALGTSYLISADKIAPLRREVDPLYFFGCDPKTNTYSFWSLLEQPGSTTTTTTTPGTNRKDGYYKMQLYFSWIPPTTTAAQDDDDADLIPAADVFRHKASTMFPRLREVVAEMPDDAVVRHVNLVEWPLVAWDGWDGRATLAGDAAHCMSICEFHPSTPGLPPSLEKNRFMV